MTVKASTATRWLLLALTLSVQAQTTEHQASLAQPKVVALTPGVCAQVGDGDIVTFEWNPAFSSPFAVSGLHNFSLYFAKSEDRQVRHPHPTSGFALDAVPPRGAGAPLDSAITAEPNGFFQLRFRANLQSILPGEYHLVDAGAEPNLDERSGDVHPQMTNSPARYNFCVEVLPASSGRSRAPHS